MVKDRFILTSDFMGRLLWKSSIFFFWKSKNITDKLLNFCNIKRICTACPYALNRRNVIKYENALLIIWKWKYIALKNLILNVQTVDTFFDVSRSHVMPAKLWIWIGFCVFDKKTIYMRCISIGNTYQSHWATFSPNLWNCSIIIMPGSQSKKVKEITAFKITPNKTIEFN